MSAPLSQDLRKRIVAAKEEGSSHAKIAREMRASVSLRERIEELSLPVSVPALCKTINEKLDLRRKKRHTLPNSRVQRLRSSEARGKRSQAELDTTRRVFLDESSVNIRMTCL